MIPGAKRPLGRNEPAYQVPLVKKIWQSAGMCYIQVIRSLSGHGKMYALKISYFRTVHYVLILEQKCSFEGSEISESKDRR